jgi:outer membrane protein assembly factor BamA
MIISKRATLLHRHFLSRLGILGLVFILIEQVPLEAQKPEKYTSPQENIVNPIDLIDVLRGWMKKDSTSRNSVSLPGVKNVSLLPIVGYGPANGFVIGAAVSVTQLLGDPATTQLSSALLNASFTTKKQILLNLRSDLYLANNVWYIPGDVRFLFFAQPTYGLGVYGLTSSTYSFNIGGINVDKSITEQPMRFDYVRIYETVVREISRHWYAGLGVNIDYHFDIQDQSLQLDTPNRVITSHYLYSKKYGFDTSHYSTNGLSLQFIYDSRDNSVNPFKGYYANLSFRVNPTFLGSSQQSTMLFYEWRNYVSLQKSKPRNLLAFWTWGSFVTSGNVPYLALPSITWDTYGRSGRGYIQGRLRGKEMMYAETEWRFPITENGLLGGVAFVNATTASNPLTGQSLFSSVAPGYGVGLRITMNKKDRTNICVDYGRGIGSSGIYFNIRETF